MHTHFEYAASYLSYTAIVEGTLERVFVPFLRCEVGVYMFDEVETFIEVDNSYILGNAISRVV
jgi:hypothetical protein